MDKRAKLGIVVPDHRVQNVIDTIVDQAQTGRYDDRKIFVTEVTEAVRMRDRERGSDIA